MFHLIITCTGGKHKSQGHTINDALEMSTLPVTLSNIYANWSTLLKNQLYNRKNLVSPLELYKGGLWTAGIEAFNEIQGPKQLWIISCGFGLVSKNDKLCWYAATFSSHLKDSLYLKNRFIGMNRATTNRQWWNYLTAQPILDNTNHHAIHEIVNLAHKNDQILIAAGNEYLSAIYDDINKVIIKPNMPEICIVGYKCDRNNYDPIPPSHIKQFISPFTDSNKYRNFLAGNVGNSNNIQKNNKAAIYLIKQFNLSKPLYYKFP